MTTFILNSPILTDYGLWRFSGPLEVAQARELLKGGYQSAVGHQSTAELLSSLLEMPINKERIDAKFQPGDRALVFRLRQRQQEGFVLSTQDLNAMGYDLNLLERVE